MSDSPSNNSRIARNTAFLYARMVLVLIVGLYTSRVVLNVLGASDFGVYNVIAGFVALFSFLNATLSSSLQRYYNYEGGRSGEEGYASVFSVGFRVHLIMALVVILLLETFGLWYINNIMVLPEGRLTAANLLFQFSVLSLALVIIQVPFSGAVIAKERMDFYAIISIVEVLLRLVLVILLPHIPFDKLIVYALIQLFITVLNFSIYICYTKSKFTFIRVSRYVDKTMLRSILSFSGWNLLGSLAFLLKSHGVNLILNAFFGTIVNAARGVATQISGAIMGFSHNISMSFRPQLVGSYAVGNTKRTYNLFLTQSKVCYCLILMLITPVVLEMDYLLRLWLGDAVPEYTNVFAALVLVDAMISTLNTPVTQVVYATGNIKSYQIFSSLVNILLLPACWIFMKLGFDAWVAFVVTIVFSVICQIVCLLIMHSVFNYSYWDYIKRIVIPCASMTLLVPILPLTIVYTIDDSFLRLLLISLASFVVTVSLLYYVFLSSAEKELASQFVRKIVKKKDSAK